MAIGQLPGELQKVFKEARPEVKETVDRICAALQAADYPGAYEQVGRLCSLPDETPEQRRAAASALLTVTKVLQSAQAQGDQRAAQVLRSHQRNR